MNADSFDPTGKIIPQVYAARTRAERHQELIRYAIDGAVEQVKRAYDIAGGKGAININVLWEMGGAQPVLEGVLERFPKLNMIMVEAGFGWAPSLGWRLDKNFERLHSEVPYLKRKPSEYIRDHIWWTTQPMEDPERRDHLLQVIEWIGWDKLLFATDYPHWDFDEPSRVLPAGVSDANREAFYLGNAKKLYGLS